MSNFLELDGAHVHVAELTPPMSKSDALRALTLGKIIGAGHQSFTDPVLPHDVNVLIRGWEGLERERHAETFETLDCADAGAPFRILLAQAAITPGLTRFTGTARLGERPHQPLIAALRETLGPAGFAIHEGHPWPMEVQGATGQAEPKFRVNVSESSQFASALLLAAAALQRREGRTWAVELVGDSAASTGYLDLTVTWLERAGFTLSRTNGRFEILAWSPGAASSNLVSFVPGDWSSIAYLLLIAWRGNGVVTRVDMAAAHPDRAIVRVLESVGLQCEMDDVRAHVRGTVVRGIRASAAECPDLMPTLAALACVSPEPSQFDDVSILRAKESDRLEGIRAMVTAAGGVTELDGERLMVRPPSELSTQLVIDSHGDHRLAMSAAILAVLGRRSLRVSEPNCVAKSFPGFWGELARAGVQLRGLSEMPSTEPRA